MECHIGPLLVGAMGGHYCPPLLSPHTGSEVWKPSWSVSHNQEMSPYSVPKRVCEVE